MWDSGAAGDYSALYSEDTDSQEETEERHESGGNEFCTDPQEHSTNKSSIHKSFHFLERGSFIDFIDTNGEFIITAGRDFDIKVWDAEREVIIRSLVGHTAAITGVKLQVNDSKEASSTDVTVISSSEDGSIRKWSLQKGIEIRKIQTESIITCMDIMQQLKLVAVGNHEGHLDVYDLSTGQLYSNIIAHDDSIDALMVNDVHICTAVYDRPGSLRIWLLKWGKAICMYDLESMFSIEFTTLALYGDVLILGDGTEQKLHILDYMIGDSPKTLQLSENIGYVQHVAVMGGLILSSTVDKNKMAHLHVYQYLDLDHLGTFYCENMERISSFALIRNHGLKFVLGGSALAILKLEMSFEDIVNIDSSNKSPKQLDVENETIQENMVEKHIPYSEGGLSKDKELHESSKKQSPTSSTILHCHQKQPTFKSISHLPPIVKSKEPKLQLKEADFKCNKNYENEYHGTKMHNPQKIGETLMDLLIKADFQEINSESRAPMDESMRLDSDSNKDQDKRLDLDSSMDQSKRFDLDLSKDQGDIKQLNDRPQEKEQRDDFIEHPLSQDDKKFADEASGNGNTEEHLTQQIPETLTQEQKCESEKVGIIKAKKDGKKRNCHLFTKKKQQKCTEKVDQKKKKNCKIM